MVSATAINDLGQISGYALDELGNSRSFVLDPINPIPEPSTWALATIGLGASFPGAGGASSEPSRGPRHRAPCERSGGETDSSAAAGSIVRGVSIAMAGCSRARATLVQRFTVRRAFSRTHGSYFARR